MSKEYISQLNKIRQELDEYSSKYIEDDFNLKLKHHNAISELLEKRDKILENEFSAEEIREFYSTIFSNFDPLREFFPLKDDQTVDFSFLRSIKAEYLSDFRMKITMKLNENEYVENKVLEKTIYLFEKEPETTKIIWKNEKGSCPLFDFFENEEDDFEAFDIFYEFYIDMLFLADMEDE